MNKTSKVNRAAQFLPFDSLKGLQEELRAREERHSRIEKIEPDEDAAKKISEALRKTEKGSEVTITYYKGGHYVTVCGKVTQKNDPYKYLILADDKIFYEDIYELTVTAL